MKFLHLSFFAIFIIFESAIAVEVEDIGPTDVVAYKACADKMAKAAGIVKCDQILDETLKDSESSNDSFFCNGLLRYVQCIRNLSEKECTPNEHDAFWKKREYITNGHPNISDPECKNLSDFAREINTEIKHVPPTPESSTPSVTIQTITATTKNPKVTTIKTTTGTEATTTVTPFQAMDQDNVKVENCRKDVRWVLTNRRIFCMCIVNIPNVTSQY
ncbi:hypothetical protein Ddc_22194 [Ditylenchus destructor]|nr:hypothetical protein Ddc_22194 [Ditylenchus destructor]